MTIYVHDIAKLFLIYIFFDLKSWWEWWNFHHLVLYLAFEEEEFLYGNRSFEICALAV